MIKNLKLEIKNSPRGQSLIEILVAVAVGTILIGGSAGLISLSLRSFHAVSQHLLADSLMHQATEVIQMFAYNNWHDIYELSKGTDYQISFQSSSSTWSILPQQEISTYNNMPYKRYFRIYNVNRDITGNISDTGDDDPSTQKVTIFLEYGNNYISSSTLSFYLTRFYNNQVFRQTDWSGGSGQTGPVSDPGNKFYSSTNVDYYANGQLTMATSTTTPAELISSILDTNISTGVGFNSLLWQGDLGTGGSVKFQVAFSNSSAGPWNYYGPTSDSDWYQPNPDISIAFPTTGSSTPQNYRFIRYKVQLATASTTPRIDGIIINWTP